MFSQTTNSPSSISVDQIKSSEIMNGHCKQERSRPISSEKAKKNHYSSLFDYLRHETKTVGIESPFYTLDFGDVLWKIQQWKENMPNVRPFYAVKTNSDPTLLRLFALLGFSFDCASEGEMRMVIQAGGKPSNIIFAHTVKTPGALKYAKSIGVDFMTFDGEEELLKIQKHHPQAKLLIRMIPQEVKCSFDLREKFGCVPNEAHRLLKRAKELNLNIIGVSFHVGGLCTTSNSYSASIEASRKVFSVARSLGFHFRILDIGGGFKGSKGTENSFVETTRDIRNALDSKFQETDIEIIAEPGTYFVGSAGILTTCIIGTKNLVCPNKITDTETVRGKTIEKYYYLNESIYGSFFVGIEEYDMTQKPLLDESQLKQRPVYKSKLWGHTCCGNDVLVKECFLPRMEEGEYIIWYNMGAYCHVLCSSFCGIPIPPTRHILINNLRMNWNWITNRNEIENFIAKSCVVIDEETYS